MVKVALEDINDLIGHVYDAAAQPHLWPNALERLGQLMGGAAFVMSALHRSKGMLLGVVTGQDEPLVGILRTRYNSARTNPLVAAMPTLPVGVLIPRPAVHADEAYFKTDLYNEVFRPQELAHRAIACLHRTDELVCPFGILRPGSSRDFSDRELQLLRMILPHLQRGMELSLHVRRLDDIVVRTAGALDRLPLGILVTDSRGTIAHLNQMAEEIVREQDGIWLRSGEFMAWRHSDALALRAAVAVALEEPDRAPRALNISRRSGKHPYALVVTPLGPLSSLELANDLPCALIVVSDPAAAPPDRGQVLRELFNLTEREAQLAEALLEGKRLGQYADEQGISLNTVKTQLRAIFAKTGAKRQSELVRLLNVMPRVHRS